MRASSLLERRGLPFFNNNIQDKNMTLQDKNINAQDELATNQLLPRGQTANLGA